MIKRITVLLEEEVDAEFTAFCHDRGFKKSTLAARLIRDHLTAEVDSKFNQTRGQSRGALKSKKGAAQ